MSTIREGKTVALHLTLEQYAQLEKEARAAHLSIPNYLRQLCGFPVEQQGARKDLPARPAKEEQPPAPKRPRGRPRGNGNQ